VIKEFINVLVNYADSLLHVYNCAVIISVGFSLK